MSTISHSAKISRPPVDPGTRNNLESRCTDLGGGVTRANLIVLLLALGATGCSTESSEPRVLTMHSPLLAAIPTLPVGQDCTVYGKSGCLSGVCVHVSAELDADYICSSFCGVGKAPCLSGSSCSREGVCVPAPTPGARTIKISPEAEARGAGK